MSIRLPFDAKVAFLRPNANMMGPDQMVRNPPSDQVPNCLLLISNSLYRSKNTISAVIYSEELNVNKWQYLSYPFGAKRARLKPMKLSNKLGIAKVCVACVSNTLCSLYL